MIRLIPALLGLLFVSSCKQDIVKVDDTSSAGCEAPAVWYADRDGDGYGAAGDVTTACEAPTGFVADATDCDDAASAVNPGASEIWYDGADEDCSGGGDFDQDGDGYDRDAECDDLDPARYPDPTVEEVWYDGVDDNCDGNDGDQDGDGWYIAAYAFDVPAGYAGRVGDCADDPAVTVPPLNGFPAVPAADVHPDAEDAWYDGLDADCAGDDDFDADSDGADTRAWPDASGRYGDDCDDDDAAVHPGAAESWYDGVDADCAGDDDYDQDGDGYDASGGTGPLDCDDRDAAVSPDGAETCASAGDEDCDGVSDEADALGCTGFYADGDRDGFGGDSQCLCAATGAYTLTVGGDCDDTSTAIFPGATELCDGIDEDCDGSVDNGLGTLYNDNDADGYGDGEGGTSCTGVTPDHSDCDDAVAAIHPGAAEVCDALDEDCDGMVDEGLATAFPDADADGYGDAGAFPSCSGVTSDHSDCDDDVASVHPTATETCNSVDDDCDGAVDDGAANLYPDLDGDHYGDGSATPSCSSGVTLTGDCNDYNAAIHPTAPELCNGVDDDCDAGVDEGYAVTYADADGDGQGAGAGSCYGTGVATTGDCDDADPAVWTGAPELCDGRQNDCDGTWSTASEAGTASELASDGLWTDLSATLGAGTASSPASWTLREGGSLYLCPATWYVRFSVGSSTAALRLVGLYGSADTVVSGGGAGVVVNAGGAASLAMHVSGLTITGGAGPRGAGIYFGGGELAVSDVYFRSNAAAVAGGAVYVSGGSASMDDVTFLGNTAGVTGGAIDSRDAGLVVTACAFDSNQAGPASAAAGGAISFTSSSATNLQISGSTFYGNTADATAAAAEGGAIRVSQSGAGTTSITDSEFDGNFATSDGGSTGVAMGGAISGTFSGGAVASLQTDTFAYNSAECSGEADGGAISLVTGVTSAVTLDDLLVQSNSTFGGGVGAYGGGVYFYGVGGSTGLLSNSTLDSNSTYSSSYSLNGYGGSLAVDLYGGDFTVDASTISYSGSAYGAVAAFLAAGADLSLQGGTEVVGNTGHGVYQSATDVDSMLSLSDSSVHGNSDFGLYMSGTSRGSGADASCTGTATTGAGIWGNGGYGVYMSCVSLADCVFTASVCDFDDPVTGVGTTSGDVHANGTTYDFTTNTSVVCAGTRCT